MGIEIIGLTGIPEVQRGDDLAELIRRAAAGESRPLDRSVILVVAQKIVSKSEGAVVDLRTVEPSALAREWADQWGKDARLIEVILRESRRIVKMDRGVLIAETRHGFVMANAGVDQSNVPGEEYVTVLPDDPDASARRLQNALGCGAVIIADTFGRPWREGLVNVAVGVSGLTALEDYRGLPDRCGRPLESTVIALADELAAAAGLVMRKAAGAPVALISGLEWKPAEGSARALIRPAGQDLFR
ncbi:MAG: coenzyme F420-0:L-glutamate ligase [Acidobacteria bacterium]|nr:coenzyme F420-0:L-glutamate ligase [Acidobacteriota bacterium]